MFRKKILAAAGLAAAAVSVDAFTAPAAMNSLRPASAKTVSLNDARSGRSHPVRAAGKGGTGLRMAAFPDSAPSTKRLTAATART